MNVLWRDWLMARRTHRGSLGFLCTVTLLVLQMHTETPRSTVMGKVTASADERLDLNPNLLISYLGLF